MMNDVYLKIAPFDFTMREYNNLFILISLKRDMKKGLWMFVTLIFLVLSLSSLASATFIRGDANGDGKIDLSDSIYLNSYLFKSGPPPGCMDAADANDDGKVDISDGIYLNNYLFLGSGSPPPAPYPNAGADPTADQYTCEKTLGLESRFGYTSYVVDQISVVYDTFYGIEAIARERINFHATFRQCNQICNFFGCRIVCDGCVKIYYVNQGGYPPQFKGENGFRDCGYQYNPLEADLDQDGDKDKVEFVLVNETEAPFSNKLGIFNVTVSLYGDLCANRIQDGNEEDVDCGGRCGKCGRKPVIVIPGIGGSFLWKGRLLLDPILNTYDDLWLALQKAGYKENETLFAFPYDWTLNNRENALKLRKKIQEVKNLTGFGKVDLVAHSMGGLVARYYVENRSYEGDVDKLIMLGTPNGGATIAPLLVKRGVFGSGAKKVDWNLNVGLNFLIALIASQQGYKNVSAFAQNISSLRELFPVFDYLRNNSVLLLYPEGYERNTFLEALNKNISLDLLSKVNNSLIVGDLGENTTVDRLDLPQYFDVLGRGDGTVPLRSNDFMGPLFSVINTSQKHRLLPAESQQKIIELLTGNATTRPIRKWMISNWLFVTIHSPVDAFIISPSGKKIGFNGSDEINGIDLAFYSREDEVFVIPNPEEGNYTLKVVGTGNGSYRIEAGYVDEEKEILKETAIEGNTSIGKVDVYTLGVAQEINITPAPVLKPDLLVSSFSVQYPSQPKAGQNITVAFTLMNNGTANVSGVFWKVDTGSVDADPANSVGLRIDAGKVITVFTRIRYANAGNYTARVIADYTRSVDEIDEENNERSRVIQVV